MTRGVSNTREGLKILFFLYRPRLVGSFYISEARGSMEFSEVRVKSLRQ
jgi:hypothetical protein